VFASQPPGWYALLRVIAFVAGDSVTAIRAGLLAVALLGVVGAYACGYAFAGKVGGTAAAGTLAAAPMWGLYAPQVEADPAAVAVGVCALALACFAYRGAPRTGLAVAAGVVGALAVSIKLLAVVVVVPIVALALVARGPLARRVGPLAAGAGATIAVFAAAYARRLGPIWRDAFSMHASNLGARGWHGHRWNAHRAAQFFDAHVPAAWLVAAGIVAAAALLATRRLSLRVAVLWSFAVAAVAFVVGVRPLFDHHLVVLAAGLAVPAGVALGVAVDRTRAAPVATAVVALAAAAGLYQEAHRIDANVAAQAAPPAGAVRAINAAAPSGSLVASDEPILPFLAHRRVPGELVDTSYARFSSGSLTDARVLAIIRRSHVRTVVAARAFVTRRAIAASLRRAFGAPRTYGGVEVYSR
jgi:hypothetical protein